MKRKDKGFSLVELLICLCIIVLIIAVGLPVYNGIRDGAKETAFDLQVRALRQAATMHIVDGGGDVTWSPVAGERARSEINADHDAWGRYLERWPENPLQNGDFVVVIEGGRIEIMPGRDE